MKRLVALMLAVAVCLSVVGVAMADDGLLRGCEHSYVISETPTGYKSNNDTHHYRVMSVHKRCTKCGKVIDSVELRPEQHTSKDGKTYDYHSGMYHVFYQKCACGDSFNFTHAPCPGGDHHIGIVLSLPPVALEVK